MRESAFSPQDHHDGMFERDGVPWYRVCDVAALEPFFVHLVSPGEWWGFISSTGALTAGRRSQDHAVLPYRTDDQLLDSVGTSGSLTVLEAPGGELGNCPWTPFTDWGSPEGVVRSFEKTVLGDEVVLEEWHSGLEVGVRVGWRLSPRHGLVRTTTLVSRRSEAIALRVEDGVLNLVPPGATARTQRELSNLLDAYKLTELDADRRLAWTRLNSGLTDLAEPSESLRVTTAWAGGWPTAEVRVDRPRGRAAGVPRAVVRGERAALVLTGPVTLAPGESLSWDLVIGTDVDAAALATLRMEVEDPERFAAAVRSDLDLARRHLTGLVASADGLQYTGDDVASGHQAACVLFNIMRGGVPADPTAVDTDDLARFLESRHPGLSARRDARGLLSRPTTLAALQRTAGGVEDPDLRRLLLSYLPLTFSRRHGDPSRPWNAFDIRVADDRGRPVLRYEGNWRDILQNWEALAYSHPVLVDPMIRVVLDAMTVDGYNPYRLATDGPDWEVPDPEDPWSNIGYWSDHQVVYLDRLIDARRRLRGPWDPADLTARDHVYADVPYRLVGFDQALAGGGDTIVFDAEAHRRTAERSTLSGGDGRLSEVGGELLRASMVEKLLLVIAAKLVNLVPGAGIWMNTQRPEWNDANNALVGRGVSVVTAAQLYRFAATVDDIVGALGPGEVVVSAPLADLWGDLLAALGPAGMSAETAATPTGRRAVMERLGRAGEHFRRRVYEGCADTATIPAARVHALLGATRRRLRDVLDGSWRGDGLVTSYGMLRPGPTEVHLEPLGPMLEGQVAILASGVLDPGTALELLRSLRASALWCPQRHTYLLYPDREVCGLLEHNAIEPGAVARSELLTRLLDAGDTRLVARGADGVARFGGDLRNAAGVRSLLDELATEPRWSALVVRDHDVVLDLYEQVFDHASFLGRSGSFFAYEGLGSVYWHMVSKLLLAAQAVTVEADESGADPRTVAGLREAVDEIRSGLGHASTARQFGAVPTDPYSHTPSGHGARQPGMTGQVKEDILVRWGELGVDFRKGEVHFAPGRIATDEWCTEDATFHHVALDGSDDDVALAPGSLAFTWCQVPVVYRRGGSPAIHLHDLAGGVREVDGWVLPAAVCRELTERASGLARIEVLGG